MTDREILEKCVNLNNTCLNKEEKMKVMDMLYKYREAFSLRDDIGTCPNIEVEIDVTDKSPFLIKKRERTGNTNRQVSMVRSGG